MDDSIARVYRFKRILKYSIISLLVTLIALFIFEYFRVTPYNVRFTNVTSNSITVSWNTKFKTDATAIVVDSKSKLPFLILPFSKDRFFDTRDITKAELENVNKNIQNQEGLTITMNDIITEVNVSQRDKYYTHHVEIKGLEPETEYSFMVGDWILYRKVKDIYDSNIAKTYTTPESIITPYPAYGSVRDAQGIGDVPAEELPVVSDGIVYFQYLDNVTGEESNIFSSPLNETGNWYVDVGSAVDKDGNDFKETYKGGEEGIYVTLSLNLGSKGQWERERNASIISPTEPFVINIPIVENEDSTVDSYGNFLINKILARETEQPTGIDGEDCPADYHLDNGLCVKDTYTPTPRPDPEPIEPPATETKEEEKGCGSGEILKKGRCVKVITNTTTTEEPNYDDVVFVDYCGPCRIMVKDGGGGHWEAHDCPPETLIKRNCNAGDQYIIQEGLTCETGVGFGEVVEFNGSCKKCSFIEDSTTRDSDYKYIRPKFINANTKVYNPDCSIKEDASPKCDDPKNGVYSGCEEGTVANYKNDGKGNITWDCVLNDKVSTCNYNPTIKLVEIPKDVPVECSETGDGHLSTIIQGKCVDPDGCKCNTDNIDCGKPCNINETFFDSKTQKDCENLSKITGIDYTLLNNTECIIPDSKTSETNCAELSYTFYGIYNELVYYDGHCIKPSSKQYFATPDDLVECYENGWFTNLYKSEGDKNFECYKKRWKESNHNLACELNAECPGYYYCYNKEENSMLMCPYNGSRITQVSTENTKALTNLPTIYQNDICNSGTDYCLCIYGVGFNRIIDKGDHCNQWSKANDDDISLNKQKIFVSKSFAKDLSEKYIIDQNTGLIFNIPEGTYIIESNGEFYSFDISKYTSTIANNSILLYVDTNSNGIYDKDIDKKISDFGSEINIINITHNYKYPLKKGFNFISMPFVVFDEKSRTAAELLKVLNEVYGDVIYSISKYDGSWKVVGQNVDVYDNNNFQLVPGQGYVIKAKEDVEITIPGKPVKYESEEDSAPISIFPGWNLIGIYGTNVKQYTAKSMLQDINSYEPIDFTANNLSKWDSDVQRYDGLQLDTQGGVEMEYGFDYTIDLLKSYFLRVESGEGNWQPSLK